MAKGENIYKRKDGRWEGRYPKGRKTNGALCYGYIYARTYREVKEKLIIQKAQWLFSDKKNNHFFVGTFGNWADLWLNHIKKEQLKLSTYASYSNKLHKHILPVLGDTPLEKIEASDVDCFVKELGEKISTSSLHIIFRLVKSCFQTAKERGYIHSNPCDQTILPVLKKTKVRALSRQEQKAVEQVCLKSDKNLPILLALETGMRIGEICALKWEDIDFTLNTINVRRTKQRISNPHVSSRTILVETSPKTMASVRLIPLTKKIKILLENEKNKTKSDYVISIGVRSVEPRTINYRFRRIKQIIGLSNVTFHSLRHTFATRCVELGGNIASISAILGHSSIKLTLDTYTYAFLEEQQRTIQKLELL
ncbi:tyrosine-type recombinase/integrase [Enterococcus rivorum]|uniref:Integrase n=1 Tax=Enterococcus rivorum TaxID=762845 RepID=A0A1E5KWZ0_9ENTE|nr:site-specific integrase [Enterococcus rivorum]MBP2097264.1 integrase [Enterococcus rivorum]OEH82384.1 hypothetical protein BCR26_02835 [Enterococcus rivorum]